MRPLTKDLGSELAPKYLSLEGQSRGSAHTHPSSALNEHINAHFKPTLDDCPNKTLAHKLVTAATGGRHGANRKTVTKTK